MKICWTACIAAGFQALASASFAETPASPESPKVINKEAAKPADVPSAPAKSAAGPLVPTNAAPKPAEAASAPARNVGPVVTISPPPKASVPTPTSTPAVVPAAVAPPAAVVASPSTVAPPANATQPAPATKVEKAERGVADPAEKIIAKTVAPPPKPQPSVVISVDLTQQRMTVTEDGVSKHQWPISSGRSGYATPTGSYRPQWMAKMWRSRKYDDAPMPNSIFFTGGFAIHATFATGMLGRPASHGCVRLAPANAATLFKIVQSRGMDRTKISVFGSPRHSEPAVAHRDDGNRVRHAAAMVPVHQRTAALSPQQRYAMTQMQAQGRYGVPPQQKKGLFAAIFGSNEPEPQRVVMRMPPQQMMRMHPQQMRMLPPQMRMPVQQVRMQQRPLYVYTQNGQLVRVR